MAKTKPRTKDAKKVGKVKHGARDLTLDGKVKETGDGGHLVFEQDVPANTPASPTFKQKGKTLIEDHHYTISGDVITWLKPISIFAPVEVYDGAAKVGEWSAVRGDF
jgi:hypothetical protein